MFSLALAAATGTSCPAAAPLPQNESPTASVFLQVLAPLPESSETHRGQVFPPEQEHDYATNHEALPAARGGCQPGAGLRSCSSLGEGRGTNILVEVKSSAWRARVRSM